MRTVRPVKGASGYRRVNRPARKSDLDFNYAVGDGIELLNPAHWDCLVDGQSLFLQRAFCRIMEAEGPRGLKHRYGIIYRRNEPIAALAIRIAPLHAGQTRREVRVPRRPSGFRPFGPVPAELGQADAAAPLPRLMLCGDFYASGFHGIALRQGEDLGALWPAIVMLLQKIQLQEGLARDRDYLLIKDVPSMPASDTRLLRTHQYRRFETSPTMVLDLSPRWTCYEDYLAQLNVRYRLVAHRAARELFRQGFETGTLDHLAPWAERMSELNAMVQRKADAHVYPMPRDFLPMLTHQLPPSLWRCSALFQADSMAGFVVVLKDRDEAVCYAMGWDTAAAPSLPVLPSLLHAAIRDALALGCRRLNFGRTALRLKAQLGATPEPSELWIQHARPELGLSVGTILETLSHAPSGDVASPLPI